MTGTRGPIGKRPEERRRKNKPENEGRAPETPGAGKWGFERPEPSADWHPIAFELYESLEDSGQSEFYQLSDWIAAYLICETISRDLKPQFVGFQDRWNREVAQMEHLPTKMTLPMKGANLSAYQRMFATLGVTEGDRRRIGIVLSRRPAPESTPEQKAARTVIDAKSRFGA